MIISFFRSQSGSAGGPARRVMRSEKGSPPPPPLRTVGFVNTTTVPLAAPLQSRKSFSLSLRGGGILNVAVCVFLVSFGFLVMGQYVKELDVLTELCSPLYNNKTENSQLSHVIMA